MRPGCMISKDESEETPHSPAACEHLGRLFELNAQLTSAMKTQSQNP